MCDRQVADMRFCFHFWMASTRSYARKFFLMRQGIASGSLYFKNLIEEMFTRWLNLHMLSRKNFEAVTGHPGPDSDDSWDLVDLGVVL